MGGGHLPNFVLPLAFSAFVALFIGAVALVSRRARRQSASIANRPMSNTGDARRKAAFGFMLFGGVFGLIGACVTFFAAVRPAMESINARNWPTTDGVVTHSEVVSHSGSDNGTTYSIDIQFLYTVAGHQYTGTRYDTRTGSSSSWNDKNLIVYRNPPGRHVTVHYLAADPQQSLLSTDIPRDLYIVGGIGGAFALFGTLFAIIGPIAARRNGTNVYGQPITKPTAAPMSSRSKRRTNFIGILIFTLFWNGIVWPIYFFSDHSLCLLPFLAIGLLVACITVYSGLQMFNPTVQINLPDKPIRAGQRTSIGFQIDGNIFSLQSLKFVLEGREKVTFQQGTNSRTERKTVWTFSLLDTTQKAQMERGTLTLDLPTNVMPSFAATNNAFEWVLICRGDIPRRPDIKDEFPITVLPAEVRR